MFLRTFSELILSGKTNTRNGKESRAPIHWFYVATLFIVQYIGLVDTIRCVMRHNNGIFFKIVHCQTRERERRRCPLLALSVRSIPRPTTLDERTSWMMHVFSLSLLPREHPHHLHQRFTGSGGGGGGRYTSASLNSPASRLRRLDLNLPEVELAGVVKHNFAASSFSLRNSN